MTFRQNFKCQSCGKVIALRIQLGYREIEEVSFTCPECARPISVELHLDQDKGEILGFERLKGVDEIGEAEPDFVVNHSPDFAQPIGLENAEGVSAFVEAFRRGGGGEEFFFRLERQKLMVEIAADHSDTIRQMIETYRQENWKYYEPLGEAYLVGGESIKDPITRESTLLRAMEHYIGPLVLSAAHTRNVEHVNQWISDLTDSAREPFVRFMEETTQQEYLGQAWSDALDLYLRFFGAIEQFRQILAEWDPETPNEVDAPGIRITSVPSFDYLKSVYVDSYEFLARVLTLVAGLENAETRGDHSNFPQHKRYKDFKPKTLAEFQAKPNAPKLDYLGSHFGQEITSALESALRNGLGHFSARFDQATGMVKYRASDGTETDLPYGSFLLRLMRLAMRLLEAIHLIKFLRTYEMGRPWDQEIITYGVNQLGLTIAEGRDATDKEPCGKCGHTLLEHTGTPGVLSEFAPFVDCDSCDCEGFVHSQQLYILDGCVAETRLR